MPSEPGKLFPITLDEAAKLKDYAVDIKEVGEPQSISITGYDTVSKKTYEQKLTLHSFTFVVYTDQHDHPVKPEGDAETMARKKFNRITVSTNIACSGSCNESLNGPACADACTIDAFGCVDNCSSPPLCIQGSRCKKLGGGLQEVLSPYSKQKGYFMYPYS